MSLAAGIHPKGVSSAPTRPRQLIPLIGTPSRSSTLGSKAGLLVTGEQKRLLGWAAFSPEELLHGRPCQSKRFSGGGLSLPSHQMSPPAAYATFVKMVSRFIDSIAFGLDR